MALIGIVQGKELLSHPKSILRNTHSYLETSHDCRAIWGHEQRMVFGHSHWPKVIGETSLVEFRPKTEPISNTPDHIESNKFARLIAGDLHRLRSYARGERANIQFPFRWLFDGKQIECSNLADFWMVAKFPLMLGGIGGYWHRSGCGEHLRINLDIFRNRVTDVFYREFEHQYRLVAIHKNQAVYGVGFYGQPWTPLYLCSSPCFLQLLLKNRSRPKGSYGNPNGQRNQHPVSGFRLLAWSILPATEPIPNEDKEVGWPWWCDFIGGFCIVEIGGLSIWRVAHWMDDGLPIRIGVMFIILGLVFVSDKRLTLISN